MSLLVLNKRQKSLRSMLVLNNRKKNATSLLVLHNRKKSVALLLVLNRKAWRYRWFYTIGRKAWRHGWLYLKGRVAWCHCRSKQPECASFQTLLPLIHHRPGLTFWFWFIFRYVAIREKIVPSQRCFEFVFFFFFFFFFFCFCIWYKKKNWFDVGAILNGQCWCWGTINKTKITFTTLVTQRC